MEQFRDLSLVCELTSASVRLGMLKVTNDFLLTVREKQRLDLKFVDLMLFENQSVNDDFKVDD